MLESQDEFITTGPGNVCIRLLDALIIHNFRHVIRVYRRNNQLHIYTNIPEN